MHLILISLLLFLTPVAFSQNKTIPAIDIKKIDGGTFNTGNLNNEGKPMIISFWETWCKPCIKEFDAIAENYDEWKKETGVKLIAVSVDDSRTSGKVASLVNAKGWDYEVYLDKNHDFKRAMNINFCPYTFLIDGKGEIVWQKGSYSDGDEIELYEMVKKLSRGEKIE